MAENTYELRISEWMYTQYNAMSQYSAHPVGIPRFECSVETNDIDLLIEINQLLLEYAERKRKELKCDDIEERIKND